jgi:hypothetical protein
MIDRDRHNAKSTYLEVGARLYGLELKADAVAVFKTAEIRPDSIIEYVIVQ